MSDSLRTRIAAVHQAHRWGVFRCDDGYARTCCRCQWREIADGPTHAEHVADAVIRELKSKGDVDFTYRSDSSNPAGHSADLRTRIIAALRHWKQSRLSDDDLALMADAVIRELNMVKEDGECSYCHAQLPGCRYICDWKTDE